MSKTCRGCLVVESEDWQWFVVNSQLILGRYNSSEMACKPTGWYKLVLIGPLILRQVQFCHQRHIWVVNKQGSQPPTVYAKVGTRRDGCSFSIQNERWTHIVNVDGEIWVRDGYDVARSMNHCQEGWLAGWHVAALFSTYYQAVLSMMISHSREPDHILLLFHHKANNHITRIAT